MNKLWCGIQKVIKVLHSIGEMGVRKERKEIAIFVFPLIENILCASGKQRINI